MIEYCIICSRLWFMAWQKNEISANKLVNENKIIYFWDFLTFSKSLGRVSNFVEIKVSEIVCKLDSIYWAGSVWSSVVLVRNIGGYWGARGSFRGNAGGSIQFLSGGGRALKIHMYPYSIEWPALWRIMMNSLHNEGVYKWVN